MAGRCRQTRTSGAALGKIEKGGQGYDLFHKETSSKDIAGAPDGFATVSVQV